MQNNRIIILFNLITALCFQFSFGIGQNLNFQSNNLVDLEIIKTDIEPALQSVLEKYKTVLEEHPDFNPENITIDLIFLDPETVAGLTLKNQHSAKDKYVDHWQKKYPNETRILFYYTKQVGKYNLTQFKVSDKLYEAQVPDIVEAFIWTNIITPKLDDYKEATAQGINALKNAFDQQYKNRLLSNAPEILTRNLYKVNYAYWGPQYYFYLEPYQDQEYFKDNTTVYTFTSKLYDDVTKTYSNHEVTKRKIISTDDYFNWDGFKNERFDKNLTINSFTNIEHKFPLVEPLCLYTNEEIISLFGRKDQDELNSLEKSLLVEENYETSYNFPSDGDIQSILYSATYPRDLLKQIIPFISNYPYILTKANIDEFSFPSKDEEDLRFITTAQRLKVSIKKIDAGKEMSTNWIRKALYNKAPENCITWCNKYVEDVSEVIFPENSNYLGIWKHDWDANVIYDKLPELKDFVLVSDEFSDEEIWNFVNAGFILFISYKPANNGIGHIELGWPDENGISLLTIGAGGVLGKKSFMSAGNRGIYSQAFPYCDPLRIKKYIYLGHLKL